MSIRKVAHRYAAALADLVIERGQQAVVQAELKSYNDLMQRASELRAVFANPAINAHQKADVLKALLDRTQPSDLTKNFLRLLLKNERLHHLDEVYTAFLQEMDERLGITTAYVSTARPLTEDERRRVQIQLEEIAGKKVRIKLEADPDLIGGVVARIGSEIFDGSIRTQLENIRRQLSQ